VLNIGEIDISSPMLMNERQRICAVNAQSYLETAIRDLIIGITPDAVNIMIDSAINLLGVLSGEKATNTVTDEVFAKFCVGK
jgi:tRNA modification GTPase